MDPDTARRVDPIQVTREFLVVKNASWPDTFSANAGRSLWDESARPVISDTAIAFHIPLAIAGGTSGQLPEIIARHVGGNAVGQLITRVAQVVLHEVTVAGTGSFAADDPKLLAVQVPVSKQATQNGYAFNRVLVPLEPMAAADTIVRTQYTAPVMLYRDEDARQDRTKPVSMTMGVVTHADAAVSTTTIIARLAVTYAFAVLPR